MSTTGTATITATLLNAVSYTPIGGQTYTFNYRLSGTLPWTFAATAITNPSGQASYQYTLPIGTYDFQAVFTTSDNYNGSSNVFPSFSFMVNTITVAKVSSP